MSEWAHLQNAKHIDWVIESLRDNHNAREEAWCTLRDSAWGTALDTDWDEAFGAAWHNAWNPAWEMVWTEALEVVEDIARTTGNWAIWQPARGAILVFMSYDNCEKYLKMSYDQLLMWSELDPHPAVLLLLPYLYVKELTKEVDLV